MPRINRDSVIAIALLVVCGVFFRASGQIEDPGYVSLSADVWPRLIITALAVFSLIYLVRSMLAPPEEARAARDGARWFRRYRNPLLAFIAFGVFLVTLPWLGMLIGGVLFVFAMLCLTGGANGRLVMLHAAIAVISVGAMWAVFTFALRVILPGGEILPTF